MGSPLGFYDYIWWANAYKSAPLNLLLGNIYPFSEV